MVALFYCLLAVIAIALIVFVGTFVLLLGHAAKNPNHNVGPSDIDEWRATYGKFEGWPNVAPKK